MPSNLTCYFVRQYRLRRERPKKLSTNGSKLQFCSLEKSHREVARSRECGTGIRKAVIVSPAAETRFTSTAMRNVISIATRKPTPAVAQRQRARLLAAEPLVDPIIRLYCRTQRAETADERLSHGAVQISYVPRICIVRSSISRGSTRSLNARAGYSRR